MIRAARAAWRWLREHFGSVVFVVFLVVVFVNALLGREYLAAAAWFVTIWWAILFFRMRAMAGRETARADRAGKLADRTIEINTRVIDLNKEIIHELEKVTEDRDRRERLNYQLLSYFYGRRPR